MSDFRVGDEVVCVDAQGCPEITEGATYTVAHVVIPGDDYAFDGHRIWKSDPSQDPAVWVNGGFLFWERPGVACGYRPSRFRKVIRRDLTAWLSTAAPAPHLDKRKVRA